MFNQVAAAAVYTALYAAHKSQCTGKPLTRKDFACIVLAVGFPTMIRVYS